MSSELIERLETRWMALGNSVRPGVSNEQIRSFEALHAVLLPDDLRDYLSVMNGTGRYSDMDDGLFCFWSLEEFTQLSKEYPDAICFEEPNSYFLFADQSINLPAYAVRLSGVPSDSNPIVAIFSDGGQYSSHLVAKSFTLFVEEYLARGSMV